MWTLVCVPDASAAGTAATCVNTAHTIQYQSTQPSARTYIRAQKHTHAVAATMQYTLTGCYYYHSPAPLQQIYARCLLKPFCTCTRAHASHRPIWMTCDGQAVQNIIAYKIQKRNEKKPYRKVIRLPFVYLQLFKMLKRKRKRKYNNKMRERRRESSVRWMHKCPKRITVIYFVYPEIRHTTIFSSSACF